MALSEVRVTHCELDESESHFQTPMTKDLLQVGHHRVDTLGCCAFDIPMLRQSPLANPYTSTCLVRFLMRGVMYDGCVLKEQR